MSKKSDPLYVPVNTREDDTVGLLRTIDEVQVDEGETNVTSPGDNNCDGGVIESLRRVGEIRECRDTAWRNIYVLFATFTFAILMVAFASGDLDEFVNKTDPQLMDVHAHCNTGETMPDFISSRNRTMTQNASRELNKLNRILYSVIFGTAAFMFLVGTFILWMFQRHGRTMTWGVLVGYLLLITMATIGFFVQGATVSGFVCLVLLAFGSMYVGTQRGREKIELIAKLMKAAGKALAQNPHVFTVTIGLVIAQIALVSFIIVGASHFVYHGKPVVNPHETLTFIGVDAPVDGGKSQCFITADDGKEYYAPCCVWKADSWTTPFIALTYLFMLWTFSLSVEIRTYITGGTVAHWYFSDSSATNSKGTTIDATKNAFGPSFGSLCFGSLVTTIVRRIRAICGPEGHRTVIGHLLSPVLIWVDEWTIFFTKYTTIRCAMSGERFYDAGIAVYRLVSNNLFSAFGIWLLPARLLGTLSLMFTLLWSTLMVAVTSKAIRHLDWDAIKSIPRLEMYNEKFGKIVVALYAVLIGWGILSFMLTVMCKAIDACFLCFMMDKEHNNVTKEQVYSVFEQMKETERRRKELKQNGVRNVADMADVELPDISQRSDRIVEQPGETNVQYGKPDCNL